ncbi:MAG TPA: hypothetical protein VGR00_12010, partial [Thermoanaerobaculia bacterium]|nr:hypothetical protein [Thermoanaerobaculia bacterium]
MKSLRRALLPPFAAFGLVVAALGAAPPAALPHAEAAPPRTPGAIAFLAFGDQGTGGTGQKHVAASMAK